MMLKKYIQKAALTVLSAALALQLPALPGSAPLSLIYGQERAAQIKGTSVNLRSDAGTSAAKLASINGGASVTVISEKKDSSGQLWYQLRYGTATGYVRSDYVKFPTAYQTDGNFEAQLTAQGFPESYKSYLRQLHAEFPAWNFVAVKTGLDWNTVLSEELKGSRSLVHTSSISSYKSTDEGKFDWNTSSWPGFDGASWVAASQEVTAYYLDPRNFLNETYIFQFESQKYQADTQNREGLAELLKNSFMSGGTSGSASGTGASSSVGSAQSSGSSTVVLAQSSAGNGAIVQGPGTAAAQNTGAAESGAKTKSAARGKSGFIGFEAPTAAAAAAAGSSTPGQSGSQDTQSNSGVVFEGPGSGSSGAGAGSSLSGSTLGPGGTAASGSSGNAAAGSVSSGMAAGPGSSSASTASGSASSGAFAGPGATASGGSAGSAGGSSSPTGNSQQAELSGSTNYVDILMSAAAQSGVSPYALAAMIMQEQGRGSSDLISGRHSSYPGIYNYFNIGAYAENGMSAVQRGLWFASQSGSYGRPWNTPEKAIVNGALYYAANYVNAGQDTLYLKKWNVQGSNMYKHQYMTNVEGAAEEGAKLGAAYPEAVRKAAHTFRIPVYQNMPQTAAAKPTGDGSPNNKLKTLYAEGFSLTPSFNMDTDHYTLVVEPSVTQISLQAQALHAKAKIEGDGTLSLTSPSMSFVITVTAENGSKRQYTVTVNKQSGGQQPGTAAGQDTGVNNVSSGSASGPGRASSGQSQVTISPVGGPVQSGASAAGSSLAEPGGTASGGSTAQPGGSASGGSQVQIGVGPV